MRHFLIIDPPEKLVVKKDSSLLLALALKERGHKVYLTYKEDLCLTNKTDLVVKAQTFEGEVGDDFYIKDFRFLESSVISLEKGDTLHFRPDPPFDETYLKLLWKLIFFQSKGVTVLNDPKGVMIHNEKLLALAHPQSVSSFIGGELSAFKVFLKGLKKGALIMKPLDLYQGIGVEKVEWDSDEKLILKFQELSHKYGTLVVQPFLKEVQSLGETRAIYFKGHEIGSIIKKPAEGEFLANVAQGASYKSVALTPNQKSCADEIARDLMKEGVDWVAYDFIGDYVSEVNITCPGLLVEVSSAHQKNLALEIASYLE
jgi:glutathione synthase